MWDAESFVAKCSKVALLLLSLETKIELSSPWNIYFTGKMVSQPKLLRRHDVMNEDLDILENIHLCTKW